ncbi:MAG: right-handed parallel beta-helix repeat-containing protein [Bryobacterales bacterium]|nr:right-handed parallel beta-helix repeat-containing protein [Bryobacterales bacterium]
MTARIVVLLSALVFGQALWAQTACPTPLTTSQKLSANCTGGIQITADNVFLDLNGKTLSCGGVSFTGIEVLGRRGVRIENGTVLGCGAGIYLQGGGKHTIKKVKLYGTGLTFARGLVLEGSAQNWIEGVEAKENTIGVSLSVFPTTKAVSYDNTLKAVKLEQNTAHGLVLDADSTDNEVRDSTISNNGQHGIYFGERAARNSIIHNNIENNGWVGMDPYGANFITKNAVKKNGLKPGPPPDQTQPPRGGIVLRNSNNIVLDNDVLENTGDGIAAGIEREGTLNEARIGNSIKLNTTDKNTLYDLADYPFGLDNCAQNDWKSNTAKTWYEGCERNGGDPDDLFVVGNGTAGANKFEFHAKRKRGGATKGHMKILNVASIYTTPSTVEGAPTCLVVDSTGKRATVGMIIEKSTRPELLYKTLHVYVSDAVTVGTAVVDQLALAPVNKFAPGDCLIDAAVGTTLTKGKISIDVR